MDDNGQDGEKLESLSPETIGAFEVLGEHIDITTHPESAMAFREAINYLSEDKAVEGFNEGFEAGQMFGRWEVLRAFSNSDWDTMAEYTREVTEYFEENL